MRDLAAGAGARMKLRTSDFDYELPPSLIAQFPAPRREESRLLVYDAAQDTVFHRGFPDIADYLSAGDLLVVNDTRVIPARLTGRKAATGGKVEILLVRDLGGGRWSCLVRHSGRLAEGAAVEFPGSRLEGHAGERCADGTRVIRFSGVADVAEEIERIGRAPLPPYIRREPAGADRERYQTIYARKRGAVAAPTAGLHFSRGLIGKLEGGGVEKVAVTLHVGPGTFLPVREEFVEEHRMHAEYFELGAATAAAVNEARREGRRVVVVGTTTARVLETAASPGGEVSPMSGWTEIFIHPPYRFRAVRNLLTNFHLPRSTLLMMVAALVGRERLLDIYEIAVREGYRFYSYGDAMLILNSG